MDKEFSTVYGEHKIKSVQVTFDKPVQSLQKSITEIESHNTVIPHIPNPTEKIEQQLSDLGGKSYKTNKQIVQTLMKAQAEIESLKNELKLLKKAHKHDLLNSLIASIIGAVIGVVLTIFATKNGLL